MSDSEQRFQDNQEPQAPIIPILLGIALLLAVVIGGIIFAMSQNRAPDTTVVRTPAQVAIVDASAQSDGIVDLDDRQIADFALTDHTGETVQLSDFSGKYVLVYFGYTHCPDFCPTTLTDYKLIKRDLMDLAERVEFVMVSVDPKRDTPEVLNRFLQPYDETFIGLTATVPEDSTPLEIAESVLRPITDDFGIFFQINDTGQSENYSVDHTSSKFLINPDGELITQYSYGTLVPVMVADLRNKLSQ